MKRAFFFPIEHDVMIKRLLLGFIFFVRYATVKKVINLLYVEYERKFQKKISNGRPYFFKIQPTNKCDSGCIYCLKERLDIPLGTMSLQNFKKIVDSVKDYAYMIALHYSGEPLLHNDIYEMVAYVHTQGIATYISTNLQHLKNCDAERMIMSGLDLLTVAIDGITDETYLSHRQGGDITNVINNIKLLVETKKKLKQLYPVINLQFLVTSNNEHEVLAFKTLAKDLGVDMFDLKPVGTYDKKLLPKNPCYLRKVYREKKIRKKACWWLWGANVILWNGDIIPCCMLSSNEYHVHTSYKDFISLRNTSLLQKLRNTTSHDICAQCLIPYGNVFNQTV